MVKDDVNEKICFTFPFTQTRITLINTDKTKKG